MRYTIEPEKSDNQQTAEMMARLSEQRKRVRRFVYVLLIAIAGGLGAASICRVEPLLSANDRSRWATVRALVEYDTWQIDEVIADPQWDTIDKVRHEDHFYSTKPALLPVIVAAVYRSVNWVTDLFDGEAPDERTARKHDGWTLADETAETTRAILIIVNLLPWLAALVVMAAIGERYAQQDMTRVFLVAAASLGTILTSFLVTLNNHLIAVVCLVFALYPAMRIVIDGERRWWLFALCGFFAALTCTMDLPAALFGLLIFGLLFWKSPKPTLLFFGTAALIPLVAYFYTNYLATGGWKPFYAYYGTDKYEYVYKGVPSYWKNPTGIDANDEPPWLYFLHCTIGHHGIFSLTPIFLLSVAGWIGLRKWGNRKLAPFLWLGLILTLAVLGFYMSRTQNYNYGGNTAGLRWTFWLIPFWLIAMIPVVDRFAQARWFRGVLGAMLLISVFSATYSLANPWRPPWLYQLMARWEWIDYRTEPPPSPYTRQVTTWFGTFPGTKEDIGAYWIRLEGFDVQGRRIELELRAGQMHSNGVYRIMNITWKQDGETTEQYTLYIDPEAFHAGEVPANFLGTVQGEDPKRIERKLTLLRGLPARRAYSIGRVQYEFAPKLREEAFRCRESSARVVTELPDGRRIAHRCDAWLTADVPFSVIRVLFRTYDPQTGDVLSLLDLKAVAASWVRPSQGE